MPRAASSDRAFVLMVLAASAAAAVFFLGYTLYLKPFDHLMAGNDFPFFYAISVKLQQHDISLIYHDYAPLLAGQVVPAEEFPFTYPPAMLLFLWPLGYFPLPEAATLWFTFQLAAFSLAVVTLPRAFFLTLAKEKHYGLWLLAVALPAAVVSMLSGQVGLLTAALLLAACGNIFARPAVSGVCAGLLLIKPHLALLLPLAFLAGKYWRAFFVAIVTVLVLVALSSALWGWQVWELYLRLSVEYAHVVSLAPHSLWLMMVSVYGFLRLLHLPHMPALAVQGMASLAAVWMVTRVFLRRREPETSCALLIAAMFVANPYVFIYDLPSWTLPLVLLADRGISGKLAAQERALFIIAVLLPLVALPMNMMMIPLAPLAAVGLAMIFYRRAMA